MHIYISGRIAAALLERLQAVCCAGGRVAILRLGKANGDNAQVSFHAPTGQWVLCSKNVALMASARGDVSLPQWSDHRYRVARTVAQRWFDQWDLLAPPGQSALREALSEQTLVGELVGSAAHLVDYQGHCSLKWFALVSHAGDEPCRPPLASLDFLQKLGLPTVAMEAVGPSTGHASPGELVAALSTVADAIARAPLAEEGEGCVIYLVAASPPPQRSAGNMRASQVDSNEQ